MEKIEIVVKVDALEFRGNRSMAVQYVRDAVRGWKGQYMPDDSRCENYEWDKASAVSAAPPRNWKERLKREQAELGEKIQRLVAFIGADEYELINPNEKLRLQAQLNTMREYSKILGARIDAAYKRSR